MSTKDWLDAWLFTPIRNNYHSLQKLKPRYQAVLNLTLALPGVGVWWYFDGLLALAGVAWVVLNVLPVLEWVIRG